MFQPHIFFFPIPNTSIYLYMSTTQLYISYPLEYPLKIKSCDVCQSQIFNIFCIYIVQNNPKGNKIDFSFNQFHHFILQTHKITYNYLWNNNQYNSHTLVHYRHNYSFKFLQIVLFIPLVLRSLVFFPFLLWKYLRSCIHHYQNFSFNSEV